MIRHPVIPWLVSLIAASAADLPDLLRFTNDDQLRGGFRGMAEGPQVIWQHEDLSAPAAFKTSRIRHIVLRGGRPLKQLGTLSHIGLVNGDQVPGTVTALDDSTITLDTSYAGTLRIPRDRVSMLAPNPMGGRVYYHGPFAVDDWKMAHASFPDGLPPVTPEDKDDKAPGRWAFSGAAWTWHDKRAGTALIRESGMPGRAVLRFDLAWKSRLNLAIAFHADFAKPPAEEEAEKEGKEKKRVFEAMDSTSLPRLFGNSYVLQLYGNYLTLIRTSVGPDGKFSVRREHLNSGNPRLGDAGRATIELRSNRSSGEIALYVNDEFTAQWNGLDIGGEGPDDGANDPAVTRDGAGFGFMVQADQSPVRISDIVVSEWNGMPDSARSLQVDGQDVILMTNGTDRFAGRVSGLDERGRILFEGKHGRFQFPLEDVAEIRFARDRLASAADAPDNNLIIRLAPIGTVSGQPVSGDGTTLGILSPIMGKVNLSMEPVIMIDFNSSNTPIDDWNGDF
jgi:hypothetical protein